VPTPQEEPAVHIGLGKPNWLFVKGNRAGYRHLSRCFDQAAAGEPAALQRKSREALGLGSTISSCLITVNDGLIVFECSVDEQLSRTTLLASPRKLWWRDRGGLLGCALMAIAGIAAAAVFIRGLVALWRDLR